MAKEIQDGLFTERDWLEGLTPPQILDHILSQGEQVSKIEKSMNLAADVLDGYGTSVEQLLQEREK